MPQWILVCGGWGEGPRLAVSPRTLPQPLVGRATVLLLPATLHQQPALTPTDHSAPEEAGVGASIHPSPSTRPRKSALLCFSREYGPLLPVAFDFALKCGSEWRVVSGEIRSAIACDADNVMCTCERISRIRTWAFIQSSNSSLNNEKKNSLSSSICRSGSILPCAWPLYLTLLAATNMESEVICKWDYVQTSILINLIHNPTVNITVICHGLFL